MTALAGCSSGGGESTDTDAGGGDSGGGTGGRSDTTVETDTTASDEGGDESSGVPGRILGNSVEELAITNRVAKGFVDSFRVTTTVENLGGESTKLDMYDWTVKAYDSSDSDITSSDLQLLNAATVEPGETGEIVLHNNYREMERTGEDVARYELRLDCADVGGASYCESRTTEEPTTTGEDDPRAEIPDYTFSVGESYTYDVVFGDSESTETFTVTDVSGDQITVERVTEADGGRQTETYTASQTGIYDTLQDERRISYFPVARSALFYKYEGDLTAGNEFTVATPGSSTDWDSETVTVEGETTVNGITCTKFEAVPDGDYRTLVGCIADGYPFIISFELVRNGSTAFGMTLVDQNRP